MNRAIESIKKTRAKIIEITQDLTIEQMNRVPTGFNNNIIWNLGHMVAAQQGVCYKRAGLDTVVGEEYFNTFKPGTKPERFFDATELDTIKALMVSTIERLEADLKTDIFAGYTTPWTTRYGVEIDGIDDAVTFLPFHEGLHIGAIMALKKLV